MCVAEFAGRMYTVGREADNSPRNTNYQPSTAGGRDRGRGEEAFCVTTVQMFCFGKMPAWQGAPEQSGFM